MRIEHGACGQDEGGVGKLARDQGLQATYSGMPVVRKSTFSNKRQVEHSSGCTQHARFLTTGETVAASSAPSMGRLLHGEYIRTIDFCATHLTTMTANEALRE